MDSWWQLGEGSGHSGKTIDFHYITCPFCMERGNFEAVSNHEKKKPNSSKKLSFYTLACGNCKGYVMVLWSVSEYGKDLWDYKVLPWPLKLEKFPDHWPADVGRYWLQAKRNIRDENWDAASVMARSALQLALRANNANGKNLREEIDDLATKGILPPIIRDGSHQVRELGNDSAHPNPSQKSTESQDARDIVQFLDFLLEYLYTLPHQIQEYRQRQKKDPY